MSLGQILNVNKRVNFINFFCIQNKTKQNKTNKMELQKTTSGKRFGICVTKNFDLHSNCNFILQNTKAACHQRQRFVGIIFSIQFEF